MTSTAPATTLDRAAAPVLPVSVGVVRELRAHVEAVMAGFDVALVTAAEAVEIGRELTRVKRRFEAAELACAKRVADTSLVRTRADHDGAKATGRQLGVSNGEAPSLLDLAGALAELPTTRKAFERGDISRDQAAEIARTAQVRPGTETDLVAVARHESLGELKRRGRKLRANGEDAEAKARRLQRDRFLRTWIDDDGAGNGRWKLPPAQHAELLAAIGPRRDQIFSDARRDGIREPHEAYDADALVQLAHDATTYAELEPPREPATQPTTEAAAVAQAEHAGEAAPGELVHSPIATPTTDPGDGQLTLVPAPITPSDEHCHTDGPGRSGPPASSADHPPGHEPADTDPPAPSSRPGTPRGRKVRDKVIIRIDWPAAVRGHTLGADDPDTNGIEETCDIVGIGPVPVSVVRHVLEEHPILAIVLTHGTDIRSVTHLGRNATAHMRTCLEWAQQGCSVLGCPNTGRLELDHNADWAHTLHTRLDQLDWLCTKHHQQKTHDGYRLEPGTGTRRFLPPPDP
jgi:hypothetical protein